MSDLGGAIPEGFVAVPQGAAAPDFDEGIKQVIKLHNAVDPDATPFKSKYEAREILKQLLAHEVIAMSQGGNSVSVTGVSNTSCNNEEEKSGTASGGLSPSQRRLGILYYYLGLNHTETEETGSGENNLSQAMEVLEKDPQSCPNELLDAYNQLGIIWCNRSEHAKAYEYLDKAVKHYQRSKEVQLSKEKESGNVPSEADDQLMQRLEALHTHTLFFFAQVQGYLGNADMAASYCHQTLERQLEMKEYDPVEWVKNVLGLSVYYEGQAGEGRRQAYHCLDAADNLADDAVQAMANDPECRDDDEAQKLRANIARMKGKFYTDLLHASAEKVITRLEEERYGRSEEGEEAQGAPLGSGTALPAPGLRLQKFAALNLPDPPSCELASTFDDARELFKNALMSFTKALQYFVIDGFVTEHVEIKQSMSSMYRSLAAFEEDKSRSCKMHKRRINLLEPLVLELNHNVYQNYYRQLSDEVARSYGEMVDLKYLIQAETRNTSADSTSKLNAL